MVLNKESSLSRFQRHEGGGILMFVLVLFLLMALSIGMAVDFMRHEMARADLQNALDRGTLAAASLSQTAAIEIDEDGDGTWDTLTDAEIEANYENLVAEYMASRSVYRDRLDLDVTWTEDTNAKTIRASASYDLPTSFLQLIGKSRLTVQVDSFARQGFNDVELAMAFDISGSMVNNNVTVEGVERTRLEQAKIDAKAFVDDVFARDTLGDQITMSLVPYSSKVSIPKGMADAFTINPAPGATVLYEDFYCFDFDVADYTTTEMDTTIAREQFPLFKINNDHWTCPKAGNEIVPITRNKEKITDAIDALTRENWTSVYEGVKWAAAMLDPSMRAAQDEMRLAGLTDLNVAALPRDYSNTGEVIKVMVVMTDGRNT
ncbi:MAG: Tad domain-containing protein, partial [Pseudomonadota bacterium]